MVKLVAAIAFLSLLVAGLAGCLGAVFRDFLALYGSLSAHDWLVGLGLVLAMVLGVLLVAWSLGVIAQKCGGRDDV